MSVATVETIARVCHEVNRMVRDCLGEAASASDVPWDELIGELRLSSIDGVEAILEGRVKSPQDSHENWLVQKHAAGWTYGPRRDDGLKTHPCMVPYDQLPLEQRLKDSVFFGIVRALSEVPV